MQELSRLPCTKRFACKQGLHSCNTVYLHHVGLLTVLGYAAWSGKERIRPNVCSAPVKFSANGNSRSLQYLEEFGARIAMVSLTLTFGRRHFSGIWFTLQSRPMPGRLSLATALLLHDGGCLLSVKLGPLYTYTNDGSLASVNVKPYSTPPCRVMHEQST
jgi:hypothetical protein